MLAHTKRASILRAAEHFDEYGGCSLSGVCTNGSQFAYEPLSVYSTELVESDLPSFSFKTYRDPCWIGARNRGQWGDDDSPQMVVHFVRGNDQARACLLDFCPLGRI
jgi:hypothetical protein